MAQVKEIQQWNPLQPNFSGSNQAMGLAGQNLSQAGNIFNAVSKNIDDRRRHQDMLAQQDIANQRADEAQRLQNEQFELAKSTHNMQTQKFQEDMAIREGTMMLGNILTNTFSDKYVKNDGSIDTTSYLNDLNSNQEYANLIKNNKYVADGLNTWLMGALDNNAKIKSNMALQQAKNAGLSSKDTARNAVLEFNRQYQEKDTALLNEAEAISNQYLELASSLGFNPLAESEWRKTASQEDKDKVDALKSQYAQAKKAYNDHANSKSYATAARTAAVGATDDDNWYLQEERLSALTSAKRTEQQKSDFVAAVGADKYTKDTPVDLLKNKDIKVTAHNTKIINNAVRDLQSFGLDMNEAIAIIDGALANSSGMWTQLDKNVANPEAFTTILGVDGRPDLSNPITAHLYTVKQRTGNMTPQDRQWVQEYNDSVAETNKITIEGTPVGNATTGDSGLQALLQYEKQITDLRKQYADNPSIATKGKIDGAEQLAKQAEMYIKRRNTLINRYVPEAEQKGKTRDQLYELAKQYQSVVSPAGYLKTLYDENIYNSLIQQGK